MKTFRWGEEALPRGKTLLVLERDGPTVVIRAPDDASFSDYYGALVDGSGILLSSLKIDGTECVLQDLQRKNVYRIPLRLGEGIRGVQEVCGRPQVAIFGKRTENRRFDLFGDLRVVIWDFQNNTYRVYDLEVDALFCIREGEFVPRAKVKVVPVE